MIHLSKTHSQKSHRIISKGNGIQCKTEKLFTMLAIYCQEVSHHEIFLNSKNLLVKKFVKYFVILTNVK